MVIFHWYQLNLVVIHLKQANTLNAILRVRMFQLLFVCIKLSDLMFKEQNIFINNCVYLYVSGFMINVSKNLNLSLFKCKEYFHSFNIFSYSKSRKWVLLLNFATSRTCFSNEWYYMSHNSYLIFSLFIEL